MIQFSKFVQTYARLNARRPELATNYFLSIADERGELLLSDEGVEKIITRQTDGSLSVSARIAAPAARGSGKPRIG